MNWRFGFPFGEIPTKDSDAKIKYKWLGRYTPKRKAVGGKGDAHSAGDDEGGETHNGELALLKLAEKDGTRYYGETGYEETKEEVSR